MPINIEGKRILKKEKEVDKEEKQKRKEIDREEEDNQKKKERGNYGEKERLMRKKDKKRSVYEPEKFRKKIRRRLEKRYKVGGKKKETV